MIKLIMYFLKFTVEANDSKPKLGSESCTATATVSSSVIYAP